MITLECEKCKRKQSGGKFCLDCGGRMMQKVTLGVKFNPINTSKDAGKLKMDIRRWLTRIGVQNQDIQILKEGEAAGVDYILLGKKYAFKSFHQERFSDNLAAIEIFLHNRVIGIERGIESTDKAFAGYTALPAPDNYAKMTDAELRDLLKEFHPDTGGDSANVGEFMKVKQEIDRRAT